VTDGAVSTNPCRGASGNFLEVGLSYSGTKAYHAAFLPTNLPLPPRLLQLPVAPRVDLPLPPSPHILGCDVARRAVQANIVVVVHVSAYQTPGIIER
jgi:hypothetical protein